MKKYVFLIFTLFCTITFSHAQSARDTLVVVPGKDGMYFYHVVTKEETLFSLSRKYHVAPKALADFNHLTLKSQLQLFQLVKIPLNRENFNQSATTNTGGFLPLYHKVLKGETLYHISQLHGKVPDALLQKWNGLSGNEVKTGQYLIVGWLMTGKENVKVAANNTPAPLVQSVSEPQQESIAKAPEPAPAKREKIVQHNSNNIADTNNTSNINNPNNSNNTSNNSNSNNAFLNEVIASENASRNIHSSDAPVNTDNDAFSVKLPKPRTKNIENAPEQVQEPKEDIKPVREKKEPVKKEKIVAQPEKPEKPDSFDIMLNRVTQAAKNNATPKVVPSSTAPANPANEQNADEPVSQPLTKADETTVTEPPVTAVASEFEQQYEQQTDNETNVTSRKGAAGWFKSNVKPGSGRYYALCNDLPRGAIVKVINPLNEKSILVKILDVIPQGAENYNLIIKISDAAMGDLGVTQSRFWCEIQYPKQ